MPLQTWNDELRPCHLYMISTTTTTTTKYMYQNMNNSNYPNPDTGISSWAMPIMHSFLNDYMDGRTWGVSAIFANYIWLEGRSI